MKIIIVFLILTVTLIQSLTAQAQKRMQSGYIVFAHGDTLRGELEVPTRSTVARGVMFRSDSNSSDKQFYPIKKLHSLHLMNGRTYMVRKMLPVANRDTLRLLLERLAYGRANLYRTTYNLFANNPDEVYANQSTLIYYYIERAVERTHAPYLLQATTFRNDLRSLFSDCPNAPNITGKFSESNLLQLVQQYNACQDKLTP
jgi:hypothetical protein